MGQINLAEFGKQRLKSVYFTLNILQRCWMRSSQLGALSGRKSNKQAGFLALPLSGGLTGDSPGRRCPGLNLYPERPRPRPAEAVWLRGRADLLQGAELSRAGQLERRAGTLLSPPPPPSLSLSLSLSSSLSPPSPRAMRGRAPRAPGPARAPSPSPLPPPPLRPRGAGPGQSGSVPVIGINLFLAGCLLPCPRSS